MNQIFAYAFLICAVIFAAIPVIGFIKSKYYYVDTKPIRYWLNKKQRAKKRYKTFKKRNKKHLSVNKINRIGAFTKYNNLNKLNK
jgi:hypothetical protein